MRHLTLDWVTKNYATWAALKEHRLRPPKPFPGRSNPTRLAWNVILGFGGAKVYDPGKSAQEGKDAFTFTNLDFKRYTYIGKPNRYRCLELSRAIRRARTRTGFILEFDKHGPVSFSEFNGAQGVADSTPSYYAYHPQDSPDILLAFSKQIHMKRIGGLPIYSHIRKLSQDRVDQYYAWFEKSFRKRLRRPKQAGMILESAPLEVGDDV